MLGVLFIKFPICFRLSASPAMDMGLCFFFLLMFTSASGSILCCQQVTLARNSLGEVTESFLTGIDLDEEVLLRSDWEEVDLIESLLLISDLEVDFLTSVLEEDVLTSVFQAFLSPFD